MKKKHWVLLTFIWTLFIVSSFTWNYALLISNNNTLVSNRAKAIFQQIVVTRSWNSSHGGLYVPVTPRTRPNPYLEDSLRDLVTVDGLQLTKINPAYMTRQISEINSSNTSLRFHITSLNPIRPDNVADEWEKKALRSFENGVPEIMEQVRSNPVAEYRYMAPLTTEKSCLQCHAKQGYKEGEVRGGISISFPATLYLNGIRNHAFFLALVHFIVLFGGIAGLRAYYRMSNKYLADTEKRNKELEQINATKNKLFSIIAHDLRNPFNSILGFAEMLMNDYEKFSDRQRKEIIALIDKSSKNTFELLENLLLWSKIQIDKIEITKKKVQLRSLINEALSAYAHVAERKDISVEIDVSEKFYVHADVFTIKITIANLFSNAIKFTPTNGSIKIGATRQQRFVEVSISDSGIGIPADIIPGLFSATGNNSTPGTGNEKGSGLGLTLCKEFVEKNGGRIWAESQVGQGSSFYFTLPVENEPNTDTMDLHPQSPFKKVGVTKLKILIADDDEVSILLIENFLEQIDKEVLKANSGVDAVQICRDHPDIDLVLMDGRMPVMDGYEATQQIRKFNTGVVIIAQTAEGFAGDREKAIDAGCNDYISKPINNEELLALIQKYFG
jgi:signal transduction histidine kinase